MPLAVSRCEAKARITYDVGVKCCRTGSLAYCVSKTIRPSTTRRCDALQKKTLMDAILRKDVQTSSHTTENAGSHTNQAAQSQHIDSTLHQDYLVTAARTEKAVHPSSVRMMWRLGGRTIIHKRRSKSGSTPCAWEYGPRC